MSKAVKTRAQWAAEICAAHKQSIEGILKMGRTLIAAKDALEHGSFQKMIDHDLPFDASTAQRLMKIARDPRIANAARVQLLPMAWGTLYELTKLPDAAFAAAVESGAITPQTTRAEASQLVRIQVSESRPAYKLPTVGFGKTATVAAPRYIPNAVQTPSRIVTLPRSEAARAVSGVAIAEIERLVGELAMAMTRGDVRADDVFKGRIRVVAERLLDLVEEVQTIN
jgi:hypothetical protein